MLEDFHAQPARDRVIVALDCNAATALCLAVQLRGHAKWLKVGMTLYYAEGPKIVQTFKQLGSCGRRVAHVSELVGHKMANPNFVSIVSIPLIRRGSV